jgi:O-antigen ligase
MALRLLALVLAGAIAIRHALNNPVPRVPLKLPLALWAGIATLSLTWSIDPMLSLNELKTEIGYGMLAFFSFYFLTHSEREWKLWVKCIAASMVTTAALALWANHTNLADFRNYDLDWQHGFVTYSTYLATILPILIYMWLKTPITKYPHNLLWLIVPLFLFAGYTTLNRMFWLTSGLVFMAWAGLWWMRHGRGQRTGTMLAVALGSMLVLALLFVTVAKQRPTDTTAHLPGASTTSSHIVNTFESSERYDIWRFWMARIAEKPLVGIGFGRDLPHFAYADMKPREWQALMFAHAHNVLLDYALQLGVIGLAAFIFLLGALVHRFWHLYRSPLEEASLIGICGITTVIAMLSKNMTDDLFWRGDALLFWALMGILLGYGMRLKGRQK